MKTKLLLLIAGALTVFTSFSQSHQSCNHKHCQLQGVYENRFSFVPPPAGFVPGAERDVVISVNYVGFSQEAQAAFQYAVDIWASLLTSSVPIQVEANWENIPGNTLGYAAASYVYPSVPGADNDHYHPAALANKIAGSDLFPGSVDIEATFDSGTSWYFGTDGNTPANQFDFVSVVLHELGHGLGIIGSADVINGSGQFYFYPGFDIYDTFVENNAGTDIITYTNNSVALGSQLTGNSLYWNGAAGIEGNNGVRPRIYAPSPWSGGSSYAHLDEGTYPAGDLNSLMTPQIGFAEAIHHPGSALLGILEDIGWTLAEGDDGNCQNYIFYLETDCWGGETSFAIYDDLGNIMYSIAPGTLSSLTAYQFDICLEPGCYELAVFDEFGDGLFGSQYPECGNDGVYALFDPNGLSVVVMDTPDFGELAVHNFCIEEVVVETICDCAGTEHTIGVLEWLGDDFADNSQYEWNGQLVDFNCATWGYDCGDIAGAPVQDPYGVCLGNLPPDNGCIIGQSCEPLALDFENVPCVDNGNGILPVIEVIFSIGGDCIASDICLEVNGEETCYFLPDFDLYPGNGESLFFTDLIPDTEYTFYFVTESGEVSDSFSWFSGNCDNEETICDCAGTEHTIGVLEWLGDDFADNSQYEWNGQLVDFNCATWGYDCGDIAGAPDEDPYGVCLGNLPPDNGCIIGQSCEPLALDFENVPCVDNGNGILPVIEVIFSIGGDCIASDICLEVNGEETCYFLPDFELYPGNGESLFFTDLIPDTEHTFYFVTESGEVSDSFSWFSGNCDNEETICDCAGTEHTIGVLEWLGDDFADNSQYEWNGQLVDFNCATWGYDCGDIAGAPDEDPYGVCLGNLPPDNGCLPSECEPLGLIINQEPCLDAGGGLLPVIGIEFQLGNGCTAVELCYETDDDDVCFYLPDFDLFPANGESIVLYNTLPDTEYTIYFTSSDGTSSLPVTWMNGNCNDEETICDCAGAAHTLGVLEWLGDGYADNGVFEWNGQLVDFNCSTWGYDCGDIEGAPAEDPYGVCMGNLPPDNGCLDLPGCEPLALNLFQEDCADNGNGLLPVIGMQFSIGGDCLVEELCWSQDGGEYTCVNLLDLEEPIEVSDGGELVLFDTDPGSTYTIYFSTTDGSVSGEFSFINGDCENEAIICDCAGTQHTIGVLNWLGDGFADAGDYEWNGQLVDFNCSTWGYDCGDILGAPAEDPYGVCDGNLPPANGCAGEILGCTDPEAINYNPNATVNDGSCFYEIIEGCTDILACNYDPNATVDDDSCNYDCFGCTDSDACNFNPFATEEDGSCDYDCYGCTDDDALNYSEEATIDDGSCIYECIPPQISFTAFCQPFNTNGFYILISVSNAGNGVPYSVTNNVNGTVIGIPGAGNYEYGPFPNNSNVLITVLSSELEGCLLSSGLITADCSSTQTEGCTDPLAVNYDADATVDDGSCQYDFEICDCDNETWSPAELLNLGDGTPDNGASGPNFNCSDWAYDCGDIAGAPNVDPYGVCIGNLPPDNGCTVSVEESETTTWTVYPNPGDGNLTLVSSTGDQAMAIEIFDASGRLLFSVEPVQISGNDMRINLKGRLSAGSYYLRILSETSQKTLPVLILE